MVTLNFELTKEDYFQFYYYVSWLQPGKKSAAWKSRISNFVIYAAGLFFVKRAVSWYSLDILFLYSLFVLAVIFISPLFYMKANLRKYANSFLDDPLNQRIFAATEISFSETGIFGKYTDAEVIYRWDSIVKKTETTDHIFLYISANQAIIIPKKAIRSETDKSQLTQLLGQHIPFNAEVGHLVKN